MLNDNFFITADQSNPLFLIITFQGIKPYYIFLIIWLTLTLILEFGLLLILRKSGNNNKNSNNENPVSQDIIGKIRLVFHSLVLMSFIFAYMTKQSRLSDNSNMQLQTMEENLMDEIKESYATSLFVYESDSKDINPNDKSILKNSEHVKENNQTKNEAFSNYFEEQDTYAASFTGYSIQLSAFGHFDYALKESIHLKKKSSNPIFIVFEETTPLTPYKVLLGRFPSREDAKKYKTTYNKNGIIKEFNNVEVLNEAMGA